MVGKVLNVTGLHYEYSIEKKETVTIVSSLFVGCRRVAMYVLVRCLGLLRIEIAGKG